MFYFLQSGKMYIIMTFKTLWLKMKCLLALFNMLASVDFLIYTKKIIYI